MNQYYVRIHLNWEPIHKTYNTCVDMVPNSSAALTYNSIVKKVLFNLDLEHLKLEDVEVLNLDKLN